MPYKIGNNIFNTQKDALQHVRELITNIGICDSVKDTLYFTNIQELVKNHPDYLSKCKNLKDFRIIKNKLNSNSLELNIINIDDSIEDISWRMCVTGKPKTFKQELLSALRYSIDYQIKHFRNSNDLHKCMLCEQMIEDNGLHIDHIIHFDKLVKQFLTNTSMTTPCDFDNAEDYSNRRKFKTVDKDYELAWQKYHLENAELRVCCKNCNLKREKCKR